MNALRAFRDAYNRSYNKRPIFTLCVTNCVLGAISDSLAQGITYYDYRKNHKRFPEIMDKQLPENVREHEDLWPPPPAYDPFRTVRFAFYNFCIAPIVGKWYMVLDRYFPMPVAGAALASTRAKDVIAIKRMAVDQAFFAPSSLAVFFTVMGLAETGKWAAVKEKFHDAYKPALVANYTVWPLVQLVNFKLMPLQYRLPFVSTLGILWNAYLSWINSATREEAKAIESQLV
ncbi:hypothetical protein O0I10_012780 [Lichtheimia ornata]|uniref:Uncharacterized protein n=1 Tax=Lichtheimia ornata TaxID=688661 RepID=A0AAD7XVH3_9FUNG|nr:uncharacterized protein O0I10_012780 [Lichtheimia ornata]KAJ8651652.1 hypothetical protein O0I10_012780 [Lichtheimia ornata]